MKRQLNIISTMICLVFLSGCATADHASNPVSTAMQQVNPVRLKNIHMAAGSPVSSILPGSKVSSRIWSWQALSNRELLIYTRPSRAWLLSLGPCPYLIRTPFIGLTTSMGQIDRFSSVRVQHSRAPCRIKQIQPLDVSQLEVTMVQRPGASIRPVRDMPDASSSTPSRY